MRSLENGLKIFVITTVLALLCLPTGDAGAQTLPGAIHYWQANGNALDSVGSNNGNLIGGATYGPSLAGQAFDLTGSGDRVAMNQAFPPMNVGDDFTVSLWMKMTTPSPNWGALFDTRYSSYYGFVIAVNPNGILWSAGRCNNTDSTWDVWGPPTTLGEWHHVAVVFNWATFTSELYVDGALADSNSLSSCNGFTLSDKIFLGLSSEMSPLYEFAGLIDEIQVYDRVLDSTEIATLYTESISGVDDEIAPHIFALQHNEPNPFNPRTNIKFELPRADSVRLSVFDVSGRLVRTLVGGDQYPAGTHRVAWDGRDNEGHVAAAGVYLYRLETNEFSETKRMVLVK